MPKQLTNDRQSEPKPRANACMGVAKIMDAESVQARPLHDRSPRPIEVGPRLVVIGTGGLTGNHVGADTRQVSQNVEGRGI